MLPLRASMITDSGFAAGAAPVASRFHTLPASSDLTLQPTSRSPFGPTVSPAGWQKFTGYVASTTPAVLMRLTAPFCTFGPTCGIEMKKRPTAGSHCGCSAPLVASVKLTLATQVSAPLDRSTRIKVANGGSSALFTAMMSESSGSYVSSSARLSLTTQAGGLEGG